MIWALIFIGSVIHIDHLHRMRDLHPKLTTGFRVEYFFTTGLFVCSLIAAVIETGTF